jgi:hypothetical protein
LRTDVRALHNPFVLYDLLGINPLKTTRKSLVLLVSNPLNIARNGLGWNVTFPSLVLLGINPLNNSRNSLFLLVSNPLKDNIKELGQKTAFESKAVFLFFLG